MLPTLSLWPIVQLWFALLRIPSSSPIYLLGFPLSADSTFICNNGILLPGHTLSQLRIRQNWEAISVLHGWLKQLLFTRVADKSLARPGRKQATATKLGIYSTYSPRSSIHFLARCSNFCKTLKKKLRTLSVHLSLRVFPQNVIQLHQWRWVTLPDDYLALWKIIN